MPTHKHETAPRRPNTTAELVAMKRAKQGSLPLGTTVAEAEADGVVKTEATVPALTKPQLVTMPDNRDYRSRYLDGISPSGIVGDLVKFDVKSASFVKTENSQPIDPEQAFIFNAEETWVGFQRFHGEGQAPDRAGGLLYDPGFRMPLRETLGDTDESQWEEGLSGQAQDPWQHTILLVFQNVDTDELVTFSTASETGRRACGVLLKHYERLQRTNPGHLPLVRLAAGGFQHRDTRIGFVNTPRFLVIGRAPQDSAVKPDTSTAALIDDEIPL